MPTARPTMALIVGALAVPGLLAGQATRIPDAARVERACRPAELPRRLPGVAAVLDTALLTERIRDVTPGIADSARDLFGLLFPGSGTPPSIQLIGFPGDTSALTAAVRASVRPQPGPDPWGLRLRIRLGPPLALVLERSVYCPPAPASRQGAPGDERSSLRPDWPPLATDRGSRRVRLEAKVTLSERGTVMKADLIRRSGLKWLDDSFLSSVQAADYLPALLDGVPIPSWYRTNGTWLRL